VLDDVFRGVDLLAESDAGRSFAAFYALVLDRERTTVFEDEVADLVRRPFARSLSRDQSRALTRLLPAMQDAGGEIHEVQTQFSRSLRRFVQSEELAQDRRVNRIIREALAHAVSLGERIPPYQRLGLELRLTAVSAGQLAGMRLFNPADSETPEEVSSASARPADLSTLRAFVRESEIDMAELVGNVNDVVARRGAATPADILAEHPATQGVASVIGLLVLAQEFASRTGADRTEHVSWLPVRASGENAVRGATIPQYLFEAAVA
jgi:hypothetical protein